MFCKKHSAKVKRFSDFYYFCRKKDALHHSETPRNASNCHLSIVNCQLKSCSSLPTKTLWAQP